jgi:membrane-associated phospholipid phosphatase
VVPYVATLALYIWAFFVFFKNDFNPIVTFIILAACISIFLAFMINILVLKVSMHTTGAGGMVAMFMLLIPYSYHNPMWVFLASIVVAGAVGSARLALNAHTTREIYYGYLNGFFSFMLAYNIFQF